MAPPVNPDDMRRSSSVAPAEPAGRRPRPLPPAAPPDAAERLRLQLPANPVAASVSRTRLWRWLADLGWPPAESEDIVLAVSEAVSNAAEHAYRDQPRAPITVDAAARTSDGARRVVVTVRDYGRWRPPPTDDEYRRRGIPMMRACMDRAHITTLQDPSRHDGQPAGTRVIMTSHPVPAL